MMRLVISISQTKSNYCNEDKMPSLLVLCLLVLLCPSSSRLGAEARLPHEIELDGRSFALSADVMVTYKGLMSDHYTTEEFHSAWQSRSRIDFISQGYLSNYLAKRGTIFSTERQIFLLDRSKLGTCRRVELDAVDHGLNVQFVKLQETKHHIGTTRLLLFIQENSDKFKAIVVKSRTFEQDIMSKSRYDANLDDALTISVLYEESSALSLPLGVPSRVLVAKANQFTMLLKFTRVVPFKEHELIYSGSSSPSLRHAHLTTGASDSGDSRGDLLFDMLAVERAMGCSSDSVTSKDFVGQLADTARYRFSFSARLESESLSGPYEMAVGYEPELQMLRVVRQAGSRNSHTLVSYRHDRLYHTYKRRGSERDYFLDSILSVTQDDTLDNDAICVVMKAGVGKRLMDACENPHSLGEMLLGATEVTYLGLARVRGIEAYAFEASASRLPVWLELPSVYRPGDASEELALRTSKLGDDDHDDRRSLLAQTFTTVIYFARPESTGESMIVGNRLLLMEIFKKTRSRQLVESYSASIFDFTWQIKTVAPNGQRTEDFYSLGGECLAPATQDNHYARINLQLKGTSSAEENGPPNGVANEWLRVPTARNLAIMRAFYEQFSVPPTLAYDVESRYSTDGSVAVTMLAAERPEAPVDLVYLGRASLKLGMREQPIGFTAFSFEVCYTLAAHSRKNTLLAWNEYTSMCYMFHGGQPDSQPEAVFDMNKRAPMEVYRVVTRAGRKLVHDDYLTKLDELHERLVSTGRLLLADPAGQVNGDHDQEPRRQAYFGIGGLEVQHLNERTAYDLEDDKHLNDINKFSGLGLVASDAERNKVIESKQVAHLGDADGQPLDATMTFERCQAACLIDLECRSFSTCVVEGRLQCVLSTVDFRASTLVLQLMFLQVDQSKMGAVSTVRLEEQAAAAGSPPVGSSGATVHVRKHPTCELHNKLYTDSFTYGGSYKINLQDRLLSPVTHPEQCAQICYDTTLESMREELARFNAPKEKPEDWAHWYGHTHCAGYYYLAHEMVTGKQLEITPEQLDGKNVDGATRGYCLLERGLNQFQMARTPAGGGDTNETKKEKEKDKRRRKSAGKSQVVELRQFNLDFGVFYEKTHGVSLAETPKSEDEERAYSQVNYMRKLEPEFLEVMSAFMERGGNTGSISVTKSAANCARLCFTQITPLWPACRSFEYVEMLDKTNARKNAFCAFNTATLWEVRAPGRAGLVLDKSEDMTRIRGFSSDQVQVWHYEPRDMLVAGSLAEAFQVSLAESMDSAASSVQYLSSTGMFCLICTVLIAGLVVGARLSSYGAAPLWLDELLRRAHLLTAHGGRRARDDKDILVESATHIKFEDIVRADGEDRGVTEAPHAVTGRS